MTYVKIKQEFAVAFFSVSPACKWTWAHMTISLSKVYHMTFVPGTTPFGGCFWLLDHLYLSCFSFHPGFHQTNWRKIHPEFLARQISGFDFFFLTQKARPNSGQKLFRKTQGGDVLPEFFRVKLGIFGTQFFWEAKTRFSTLSKSEPDHIHLLLEKRVMDPNPKSFTASLFTPEK